MLPYEGRIVFIRLLLFYFLINFTGKIFDDMKKDETIIRSGLKLAIAVCQELAVERHNSLCKLGEILIPKCMNFKVDEKYELFLIFVKIHHPLGATMSNENSCIIDAAIWKTILRNMCTMILQIKETKTLSVSCVDLGCEGKFFIFLSSKKLFFSFILSIRKFLFYCVLFFFFFVFSLLINF